MVVLRVGAAGHLSFPKLDWVLIDEHPKPTLLPSAEEVVVVLLDGGPGGDWVANQFPSYLNGVSCGAKHPLPIP